MAASVPAVTVSENRPAKATLPWSSTATASPRSSFLPPSVVTHWKAPLPSTRATKASLLPAAVRAPAAPNAASISKSPTT